MLYEHCLLQNYTKPQHNPQPTITCCMKKFFAVFIAIFLFLTGRDYFSDANKVSEESYVVSQEKDRQLRVQAYFHIILLEEAAASCEKLLGQPLKKLLIIGSNAETNRVAPEVLRFRLDKHYEDPEVVIADIREAIHEILRLEESALSVRDKVSVSVLAEQAMRNRTEPEVLSRLAIREREFFKTADNELAKARNLKFEDISENRISQIRAIREEARK